jgi:hypothetical protein
MPLTPEQKKFFKSLQACLESKPEGLEVMFSTSFRNQLEVKFLKSGATERLKEIDMLLDANQIEEEEIASFSVMGYWVNSESN